MADESGNGQISRALARSLRSAGGDADAAARALAKGYARLLDDAVGTESEAEIYSDLGPKLLATLTALGLTVAGRVAKGGPAGVVVAGGGRSRTQQLRDEVAAQRAKHAGAG